MMQRIGLILLVILIEYCGAHTECGKAKKPCKNKGGLCQPRDTNCAGKVWSGKKFCKKWKDCNCCASCSMGIQESCSILNGVCIKRDEICNGTEVFNNRFCNNRDTCKCCIPLMSEDDCCFALSPPGFWIQTGTHNATNCSDYHAVPTGIGNRLGAQCCWQICDPVTCTYENQHGRCSRYPLPHTTCVGPQECTDGCQCYLEEYKDCPKPYCEVVYENQLYEGICRVDDCLNMETRADFCPGSNCNCCINNTEACVVEKCSFKEKYRGDCLREKPTNTLDVGHQECKDGCNCYINDTICGPVCTSVSVYCQCVDEEPCPEGSCFFDFGIFGLCRGCACCQNSDCRSKHNQCTDPGDFCLETFDSPIRLCPKGHARVYNACYKNSTTTDMPSSVELECDCCKSLACRPNGDKCSGKGDYCIDRLAVCPSGYRTSNDCSKPVVVNGVWVESKLCKCCTPYDIE